MVVPSSAYNSVPSGLLISANSSSEGMPPKKPILAAKMSKNKHIRHVIRIPIPLLNNILIIECLAK